MRLEMTWGNRQVVVESGKEGEQERFWINGTPVDCEAVRLPDSQYSIRTGARVFDFRVEISGEKITVSGPDGTFSFEVTDPRALGSLRLTEEEQSGLQRICAEMPGKVVRILAKEGDSVLLNQPLVVLEAMKMQNEIRAPKNGVVVEVGVAEGKTVNSGDFMISLE